jgi:hypothetical protein
MDEIECEYKIFDKESAEKSFYNHYNIMMGLSD